MIEIAVRLESGTTEIKVTGHENLADGNNGKICAAVSAITRTAALGLYSIADEHPDHVSFTITER